VIKHKRRCARFKDNYAHTKTLSNTPFNMGESMFCPRQSVNVLDIFLYVDIIMDCEFHNCQSLSFITASAWSILIQWIRNILSGDNLT